MSTESGPKSDSVARALRNAVTNLQEAAKQLDALNAQKAMVHGIVVRNIAAQVSGIETQYYAVKGEPS